MPYSLQYQHLTLFTDKHVTCTNHKQALIPLKSMVNEHKIYRSLDFSVAQ